LSCEYLPQFLKTIVNGLNGILRDYCRGKLIHEKKPEFENLVGVSEVFSKNKKGGCYHPR
jgi:hypothetical protein